VGPARGRAVMADQLRHLLDMMTLPRVSLGVIPADADRRLWPVERFWMFDDERVAVELVSAWVTINQPAEIVLYAEAFDELAALAVYGETARELITKALHAL
jgi:hypothetical protein